MTTAITFSASLLSDYYSAQSGLAAATAAERAGTATVSASAAAATPPWQSSSTAPKQSALVQSVLGGGAFFTPHTLTAGSGAPPTSTYNNLFTLYQGVTALQGLASGAASLTAGSTQASAYAKAFTTGLSQLQSYVAGSSFTGMQVAAGTLTASEQTTAGTPVETDVYATPTVYSGGANDPVPALSSGGAFTMTLTNTSGVAKTVSFDLSQIQGPKTMNSVAAYFNATLKAAGATTRYSIVDTPAPPVTTLENGKTVTLSQPPDNLSFKIVGTDQETPSFQAASTAPAVYVTSASGAAAAGAQGSSASSASAAGAAAAGPALLSFNAGAAGSAAAVDKTTLASAVAAATATATAPDGSVYVLTTVNGAVNGQAISGSSDVALMKYDSAGQLVYTRTLGAADAASGYALAVSADGSQVAVAGSVTGPLTGAAASAASSAAAANSFVATFDAAGDEQWSATQPSSTTSAATGVAFGADGSVYVTGSSSGPLPGASSPAGANSGFLQGYSAKGALSFTTQFASDPGGPAGVAVSGSSVYVAGETDGNAVVRAFTVGASGVTAGATQTLGALAGGSLGGVAIGSNGDVVVAGSTGDGSLQAGSVGSAYQGGQAGFIASLDPSLSAGTGVVSYLAAPGDLSHVKMTLSGGQAYLAGQVATAAPAGSGYSDTSEGYIAAVDPATGAVGWSQTYQGAEDQAEPTSIAVNSTGASILNSLGLPTSVDYAPSTLLVSNTALTPGDSFGVKVGSGPIQTVTISASDTPKTLALKLERASGFNAVVTTPTIAGQTEIKVAPASSTASIQLIAGPAGANALAALGLSPGTITDAAASTSSASSKAKTVTLGLNLTSGLNLQSATSIAAAKTALNLASAKIETAFASLTKPSSTSAAGSTSAASAAAVAAAQSLTANYQQALNWFANTETGASGSTGSSVGLSSLIV